jgi:hypothetical protein
MDFYSSQADFEIADEDVKELEIKAFKGFSLSGKVVIESDSPDAIQKLSQLRAAAISGLNEGETYVRHLNGSDLPQCEGRNDILRLCNSSGTQGKQQLICQSTGSHSTRLRRSSMIRFILTFTIRIIQKGDY